MARLLASQDTVKRLLDYDKSTGSLTWRENRGRARAGDEAGTIHTSGHIIVTINGRTYQAARIIWLYVTGEWPKGRLGAVDGNPENLRWDNLARYQLSMEPTARYQRRYRRVRAALATKDPEKIAQAYEYKEPRNFE